MNRTVKRYGLSVATLIWLLAVACAECAAGPVPDGLAGAPWDATRQQVQKIMGEKGFRQESVDPLSCAPSFGLVFFGPFANRMCYVRFYFKGNAFYSESMVEKGYNFQQISQAYNHFLPLLKDKYGPTEEHSAPNSDGSCFTYYAFWELRDGVSSNAYRIDIQTGASTYEMPTGRQGFHLILEYTAESLGKRLKEDGI